MIYTIMAALMLTAASDPTAESARLKAALAVPDGAFPGCAVGVYRNGKAATFAAAGVADTESKTPLGPDSQFYIASLSKHFTALALLQLVSAGKLGLDDDVRRYLPELPSYEHPITVRMLLNHTSGLPDITNVALIEGRFNATALTRKEALAMLFRQKTTRFPPGTRFEYSNGGYLLLSELAERVSGKPFAAYVQERIFKPLGMAQSFVLDGDASLLPGQVKGYQINAAGDVLNANRYSRWGGPAGVITSVADLAKWDRDIDSGHKIWTPAIARLMLTPGQFANGAPVSRRGTSIPYAGGLSIGPHWFHHTGEVNGFKSIYARNAEKRLGVAILCNDGAVDIQEKAKAVLTALDPALPAITEVPANPHKLDGRYTNPSIAAAYTVTTTPEGLDLTIAQPGDTDPPKISLTPTPDGQFRITGLFLNPDDDNDGFTMTIGLVSYPFVRSAQP